MHDISMLDTKYMRAEPFDCRYGQLANGDPLV